MRSRGSLLPGGKINLHEVKLAEYKKFQAFYSKAISDRTRKALGRNVNCQPIQKTPIKFSGRFSLECTPGT